MPKPRAMPSPIWSNLRACVLAKQYPGLSKHGSHIRVTNSTLLKSWVYLDKSEWPLTITKMSVGLNFKMTLLEEREIFINQQTFHNEKRKKLNLKSDVQMILFQE